MLVGHAAVDLWTLATGPAHLELTLRAVEDEKKSKGKSKSKEQRTDAAAPIGTLHLTAHAHEITNIAIELECAAVLDPGYVLDGDLSVRGTILATRAMAEGRGGMPERTRRACPQAQSPSVRAGGASWRVPPITWRASAHILRQAYLELRLTGAGALAEAGAESILPLAKLLTWGRIGGGKAPFEALLKVDGKRAGTLKGSLLWEGLPHFVQMNQGTFIEVRGIVDAPPQNRFVHEPKPTTKIQYAPSTDIKRPTKSSKSKRDVKVAVKAPEASESAEKDAVSDAPDSTDKSLLSQKPASPVEKFIKSEKTPTPKVTAKESKVAPSSKRTQSRTPKSSKSSASPKKAVTKHSHSPKKNGARKASEQAAPSPRSPLSPSALYVHSCAITKLCRRVDAALATLDDLEDLLLGSSGPAVEEQQEAPEVAVELLAGEALKDITTPREDVAAPVIVPSGVSYL